MDSRIIDFLRSGCCEGLLTVTVKEYPVYSDESRGTRNEKDGCAVESSSGGVTVGEVWGALSLDERMEFLNGCDRVLGRNYLEVENMDFETLGAVLRADEVSKSGERRAEYGEASGSALPLPCYEGCVVVIGNGEYFEDTMRKIAVFNGIYYQISDNIFAVSEDKR